MKKTNTSRWFKQAKDALPEEWKYTLDQATDWIKRNPSTAALIGTAAGFSIGFLGIRNIMKGINLARSNPIVSGIAGSAANGLMGRAKTMAGDSA